MSATMPGQANATAGAVNAFSNTTGRYSLAPLKHIAIQRKQLLRVLIYGLEAFAICFIGLWFLFDTLSIVGSAAASALFAVGVIVIGAISVIVVSIKTEGGRVPR
jgi:hypothetical protein